MKMTFYLRRERIKDMLRKKGHVTCAELAEQFGVSKNTIVKDMDTIKWDFPVVAFYGRHGGYIYIGDGTATLDRRQTQYLYQFMSQRAGDTNDGIFYEIVDILKVALADKRREPKMTNCK